MTGDKRTASTGALGVSLTALCGGALALSLLLVAAILVVLAANGLSYFWQRPVFLFELDDGRVLLGEIHQRERIPPIALTPEEAASGERPTRIRLKLGNEDLTGLDFEWIREDTVEMRSVPDDAIVLERLEWGNFYGYLRAVERGGRRVEGDAEAAWGAFQKLLGEKRDAIERIEAFEHGQLDDVNHALEELRMERRRIEISDALDAEKERRVEELERRLAARQGQYAQLEAQLTALRERLVDGTIEVEAGDGTPRTIVVADVVRAIRPNRLGAGGKLVLYASRIGEFLFDQPRNANTEGGIFPAIFGTVLMVFLMSFAVTPLGVLAAIYLREYAGNNWMVRAVRIAVNNLAGVPSIVFGVFGLGFFVYMVGGTIDRLFFPEALPAPTFGTGGILWASLTLALLTVPVVIVATEEGLAAVPNIVRQGSRALGATKFETTVKVVIPAAAPGILTGMILAMARAAGEVAPLMIVGMVKLAPDLPIDGRFPFMHLERKFMHLGFHIYDVGFQSQNVEAVKPLVFATALLLIGVVTVMNLVAIGIRNHLRRKYAGSAV